MEEKNVEKKPNIIKLIIILIIILVIGAGCFVGYKYGRNFTKEGYCVAKYTYNYKTDSFSVEELNKSYPNGYFYFA